MHGAKQGFQYSAQSRENAKTAQFEVIRDGTNAIRVHNPAPKCLGATNEGCILEQPSGGPFRSQTTSTARVIEGRNRRKSLAA